MDFTASQLFGIKTKGPLLITAGAGAGKTKVMEQRVKYQVEQNMTPSEIFAVTFTRDGAKELKERIDIEAVNTSTIHSLALRILREMNLKPQIIESTKQIEWAKAINFENPTDVLNEISYELTTGLGTSEVKKRAGEYMTWLNSQNKVDMDGIIVIAAQHVTAWLANDPISSMIIDEFQDTDPKQWTLLKTLILESGADACLVGDEAQSIYGFKGAMPDIFENAIQDIQAQYFQMSESFRCLPHILDAANDALTGIQFCDTRRIISMRENNEQATVQYHTHQNNNGQLEAIIATVKAKIDAGIKPKDISILARVRDNITVPALILRAAGLPVNAEAWRNPFQSKIRRCVLGLIRTRAGSISVQAMTSQAAKLGIMMDVNAVQKMLKIEEYKYFKTFALALFPKFAKKSALYALEVAEEACDGNWQELEKRCLSMTETLKSDPDGVILTTIHKAKGREWDNVLIISADDEHFPHPNNHSVEEEKRLLYVAMTRAKNDLQLFSPKPAITNFLPQPTAPIEKEEGIVKSLWKVMFG